MGRERRKQLRPTEYLLATDGMSEWRSTEYDHTDDEWRLHWLVTTECLTMIFVYCKSFLLTGHDNVIKIVGYSFVMFSLEYFDGGTNKNNYMIIVCYFYTSCSMTSAQTRNASTNARSSTILYNVFFYVCNYRRTPTLLHDKLILSCSSTCHPHTSYSSYRCTGVRFVIYEVSGTRLRCLIFLDHR